MIEPKRREENRLNPTAKCVICGGTERLLPEKVENETVYICVDCEELVDATVATVDPTPF
jgi:hypothetical protein